MSDKNDFQEFSEDAAVKFIRERLSEDVASRLSDDDILDIVDAAYDYYDDNGLLDLSDFDSDVDERKNGQRHNRKHRLRPDRKRSVGNHWIGKPLRRFA